MAPLVRPPEGVYTRRTFLKMAGASGLAVGAGGLLAACSSAGSSPSAGAVGGPFNLFTWAGYDGADVLKDWYAEQKIELNVKYITNENAVAFFNAPGGDTWDASSVNQGDNMYFMQNNLLSEITTDEVPSLKDMYPFFKDSPIWKIRDGVYNSVPWTWGPIGITTRKDRVPDGIPSWDTLLDPKWSQRIGTYDDALNMIATASVATGNDPGKLTRDQLNGPVKDWLVRLKPQLKVLSTSIGDQVNLLTSGDVDIQLVGLLWFLSQGKDQGVELGFVIPDEGSYGFVDAVYILPKAPHRANAIAYANALMEGDTAVAMNESVNQMGPVEAINAKIKPEVRDLYPDNLETFVGETLKWNISYTDPEGEFATKDEWVKVWEEVKSLS